MLSIAAGDVSVGSYLLTYAMFTLTVSLVCVVTADYAQRWTRLTPIDVAPRVCRQCGHDLRGLPERRCPECGTPFDWSAPPRVPEA